MKYIRIAETFTAGKIADFKVENLCGVHEEVKSLQRGCTDRSAIDVV